MKQQFSTASNYSEACDMLRSGYVKHVRLNWNIGSDEFFRIALPTGVTPALKSKKMKMALLFP